MNHLERGKDEYNQFWRYLVNFLSGMGASNILGIIPLVIVIAYYAVVNKASLSDLKIENLSSIGVSHNLNLLLMMFPFFVALFVTVKMCKSLHKRTVTEIINGTNTIRWKRYFIGLGTWFVLIAIYQFADMLFIAPKSYVFQFDPGAFVALVFISVLTIPVQVAYEELFFRGYLTQGIGAASGSRWLALLVPMTLFALMHSFNPEVRTYGFWLAMPQYFTFGLIFGLTTLLDDGAELAMGAHTANNLFLCLFITNDSSALVTSALFKQQALDPLKDDIAIAVSMLIMLVVFAYYFKWDFSVLNRKVTREETELVPEVAVNIDDK
jgi:membrane protease YdiL (CAAX protease family)